MADSGCRKCGEEGHFARDCPEGGGGGGDGKCRNCRQEVGSFRIPKFFVNFIYEFPTGTFPVFTMATEFLFSGSKSPGPQGHMASDCPEPEVCRRCRKEGHVKDDCPEPEKCFNCRQEGHSSADCPEPELCRKCRKPVSFSSL